MAEKEYTFKFDYEKREAKKQAKLKEKKEKFKEFTLNIPTIMDAPEGIANLMELIATRKTFMQAVELVNSAIITGIDKMAAADRNNPEDAAKLALRYKKLLINYLRSSLQ
jgi:hypothetical protein